MMDQQMTNACGTDDRDSDRSCTEAYTYHAVPLQLQEGLVPNERLASAASAGVGLDPLSLRGAVVLRYELPFSKRRRWHSLINTTLAAVLGAMVLWANVVRPLPYGQYESMQQFSQLQPVPVGMQQAVPVAVGMQQAVPVAVGMQQAVPVGIQQQQAVPAGYHVVPVGAQPVQTRNQASGNVQSAPAANQSRRQLAYSSGPVMAQPMAAQPMMAQPMMAQPMMAQPMMAQMGTPCPPGLRGNNMQAVPFGFHIPFIG
eukprot:CAMPEP_0183724310 /NCGR_PEP_ID=MMETSP0737-20130205/17851_1 /TAXON_ID=385413 /ORGANISM="Thalassiosira miniscula, Strain CCMP1093" /LENGTH=256 /DNA_ID=CAMNT_0025954873 /DNA_START=69 /DNA_END=839 /DNA_ORIENTATION=-